MDELGTLRPKARLWRARKRSNLKGVAAAPGQLPTNGSPGTGCSVPCDTQGYKEKFAAAKEKDAARKKHSRQLFKENAALHPRKFKAIIVKTRENTASRVRKCREQKKNERKENEQCPKTPSSQRLRRNREKINLKSREKRKRDKHDKSANKLRVRNYRLRIKLNSPKENKSHTSDDVLPSPSVISSGGYKHRSSGTRALKKVQDNLPSTPAKKAYIIAKLVSKTTPRSRQALCMSPTVQAVINPKMSRKRLSAQFSLVDSLRQKYDNQRGKISATSLAAMKLLGKARKVSAVSAMLNISRKKLTRSLKNENVLRKRRKDRVTSGAIDTVRDFYLEEVSREMPNKRDVLLLTDDNGQKVLVQKQIMEMTQTEAYENFKAKNPNVKVGQRKFDLLRPKQVRRTNISNRIVCCCTYCENVRHKLQTLNKVVKGQTLKSTRYLVDGTMCEKTGLYHSNACLQRNCDNCGTKMLNQKYANELRTDGEKFVTWKAWEKKRVPLDADRFVSRVILTSHTSTFTEFFEELTTSLEPHAEHLFRASWQYDQFRENVQNIKENELVMAMDFSENYTCRYGREIQSDHWNQKQITIHPMMLYYKKNGETQKEGFTTITDDLKHDYHAVSEFEEAALKHVRDSGININKVHQWTECCASQYKCRHSFSAISNAEATMDVSITRNYFETSHGKGPCDGLGGIIKRKVSNSVIQDSNLSVSSAKELTEFCDNNLTRVGGAYSKSRISKYAASSRSFKLIETIDRSKTTSAKTLSGSRKLHSVRSTGVGHQLQVRLLSCYCDGCMNENECSNKDYVQPWNTHVLKATDDGQTNVNMIPTENDGPTIPNIQTETDIPDNNNDIIPNNDVPNAPVPEHQKDNNTPCPHDFVAVKFRLKSAKVCYFAKVCEVEDDEIRVEFLEKKGENYQYPELPDESWQCMADIVCTLNEPTSVITGSRVKCFFKLSDTQKELLKAYKLS